RRGPPALGRRPRARCTWGARGAWPGRRSRRLRLQDVEPAADSRGRPPRRRGGRARAVRRREAAVGLGGRRAEAPAAPRASGRPRRAVCRQRRGSRGACASGALRAVGGGGAPLLLPGVAGAGAAVGAPGGDLGGALTQGLERGGPQCRSAQLRGGPRRRVARARARHALAARALDGAGAGRHGAARAPRVQGVAKPSGRWTATTWSPSSSSANASSLSARNRPPAPGAARALPPGAHDHGGALELRQERDVVNVMKMHCGVTVDPRDVIFRFKRWGRQSDTCYVILPTVQQVDHCIQQIQELAVPKRAAYGALFGATFLWSSRAALFLCHPDLDFLLHDSKFWVFTTGWQEDMGTDEFMALMNQMQFCPVRAVRHPMEADRSNAFFMELDGMEMTKRAMIRLRRLKWRWRMKREVPFLAYPRRVDIHRLSEDQYEDEDSAADSDIDEPVHY
ncbi:unnamed protein product, partial [Prorocentrum cordatum]